MIFLLPCSCEQPYKSVVFVVLWEKICLWGFFFQSSNKGISACSPKKCKSAGERGIYIFTIAHYLWLQACHAKADYIFFTPLLRIWSKCFLSRTKNVHTSVSLWGQGMSQRDFDTSFHIYLIWWSQKEGNWHFTMAPLLGQTVWPIWQHCFILPTSAL